MNPELDLDSAASEMQALVRDAARYRWLRDRPNALYGLAWFIPQVLAYRSVDEAIDAAIAKERDQ